jgi:D-glycero-alpha-D-manno-heptose-7-phosphate kinase
MIITRSPLRICGGGGTDLPSYYRQHTGFVISAAINRAAHSGFKLELEPEERPVGSLSS